MKVNIFKYFIFYIWLFILSLPLMAQGPVNLVFEGAGIRGIAYCGALQKLEEKNMITQVKRVGGTSAGAITALAVCLGYNSDDIKTIITSIAFNKFNDGSFSFAGGFHRLKNYFGWFRGQYADKWLAQIIEAKTGNPNITFKELKQAGKYKDLYVTGTCLNKQQLIIFSAENYPNMKVKDAVRISMSIPLYFEAVLIDENGNVFHHVKNNSNMDVMVDGGVTANFPIHMFDSLKYTSTFQNSNKFYLNNETLGVRIETSNQFLNDSLKNRELAALKINRLNDYFRAFYNITIENLNRQSLAKDDWLRTITINDGNIGPRIRKMKNDEIKLLIDNGSRAVNLYFEHN